MDMKRPRSFVYRKNESGEVENKMIYSEEEESYLKDGWADSPIEFINFEKIGIPLHDKDEVQAIGETVDDIRDIANASLNLDLMTAREMSEFAKDKFNKDIKYIGVKKAKVHKQLKALIEA